MIGNIYDKGKKIRLEEEWRRAEQSPDAATERLLTLTSKCSTTGFPTPTQHQKKILYLTLNLMSFLLASEFWGGVVFRSSVSILVGRSPEKDTSLFKPLVSTFSFLSGNYSLLFLK